MTAPKPSFVERTVASALSARSVVSVQPSDSVRRAAVVIMEADCGSVLVVSGGKVVGIVTETDIVWEVVVRKQDAALLAVESIMTPRPLCTHADASVIHALYMMKELGLRHFPVIGSHQEPLGIFSLRDAWPSELIRTEVLSHAKDRLGDEAARPPASSRPGG